MAVVVSIEDARDPLQSLKPLLENPESGEWPGPESALTALYKWRMKYDPSQENYSLRAKEWRYIRYENGKEELYCTKDDPHEWTNIAATNKSTLEEMRIQLQKMVEPIKLKGFSKTQIKL